MDLCQDAEPFPPLPQKVPWCPFSVRCEICVCVWGGIFFTSVFSFSSRTVHCFMLMAYREGLLPVCWVGRLVIKSRDPRWPERRGCCCWNTRCVWWDRAEIQECELARAELQEPDLGRGGCSQQQLSRNFTLHPGTLPSPLAASRSPAFPSPVASAHMLFQLVRTPAPVWLCGISCCLLSVSKWRILFAFPSSDFRDPWSDPPRRPLRSQVAGWPVDSLWGLVPCPFLVGRGWWC